ncbi:stress-activated map kinase-interacting protein-like protein [Dothidotthia symphoricarpi CBS 119687]|uniref:Stress-activated map kinase-interacting protein-like protein n=1 Tax=Dothidotthia symphoricarpi CBS 119687 TaxID=1392245 RepID=A0A6A6A2E2_9PLEO|nr:stress-activated map kinase-interacting protein-like protein [Dothidotthia symphoricarpi CBS 119687]KAF2126162.1 stress-activated map kinase-interacting protein-like protein [Dothidotthia symphoricarpi CBS 119687]
MSLLQNEDFVLYQLRTAYLSSIKDGVGERLINVNAAVLNNPAFRAAGWVPNAADIKRTYSPPIPTAVTSEYFQAPRSAGLKAPEGFDDDDDAGMVTGGASNDTVGPTVHAKPRRRKEPLDQDDSSDLSDESDDDDDAHRPANQIKFTKMPLRTRSGSSPIRGSALRNELAEAGGQPSFVVTSPSQPSSLQVRRGSLNMVDTVQQRTRRDTITSSDMSSENEIDSTNYRRRRANARKVPNAKQLLSQRIEEDEREAEAASLDPLHEGNESDSSMSSEFSGSADSESLMGGGGDPLDSSPTTELPNMSTLTPFKTSPRKKKEPLEPILQALPPPRPISFVLPVSALTQALQAKEQKPSNPLQRFAGWNAASEAQQNPLYIKLYCPFAAKPSKAVELLIRKFNDKGEAISVAEAIGYALHRYQEEKLEPPLAPEKMNVNCWVMRMYDDGEVDDEFPPLTRNKPLKDFASNNARGMRPRARDKPWDEFALVEASAREVTEAEKLTPIYSEEAAAALASQKDAPDSPDDATPLKPQPIPSRAKSFRNPITGPSFAPTATRKNTSNLADAPTVSASHAASRIGAPRTITVHFTDEHFNAKHIPVPCTTDTYIAEVFDRVCRDLHLDKGLYILKVSGSTTVAPSDRTVEALNTHMDLDLSRRRFVGDGVFGLSGSPGSSSPNAPLIISTGAVPKKTKKSDRVHASALSRTADPSSAALALSSTGYYRRYAVLRKQPMSFASSTARILALDNEYIHIMPGEKTGEGKTTTVHFSSVVGSKVSKKHPRMFRVIVFKERETKRYDFEAGGVEEAGEIVREIKRGVGRFQEGIV